MSTDVLKTSDVDMAGAAIASGGQYLRAEINEGGRTFFLVAGVGGDEFPSRYHARQVPVDAKTMAEAVHQLLPLIQMAKARQKARGNV